MPSKLLEITATVDYEKFRWDGSPNDTLILDTTNDRGDSVPIKCLSDGDEPQRHLTYRFYGAWTSYTNKRSGQAVKQFHAKTFVRCQPHGRRGVIAYLASAPNIGRVIAGRLYEKFQGDAVRILREQPDVAAAAIQRLSVDGASEASAWLTKESQLEGCTIDLIDLLDGRGWPKSTPKALVKKYGNLAADFLKRNPLGVGMQIPGVGFKRADALYLDLGLPPAKLKRQALCAWHAITQAGSGDTWHYVEVARQALAGSISGADCKTDKAIELAVRGRLLSLNRTDGQHGKLDWDGDTLWVADAAKARSEQRLAKYVKEAIDDDICWPELSNASGMTDHQSSVLCQSLKSPLAILGGGPGTGKSFVAAKLIGMLIEKFGAQQIGIAAPTGKASVKLNESFAEYNLPIRARTWHSLLGVEQADDGGGWSFRHGRSNPLPFKVLIGDESSMLDTTMAANIFAARARGTLVLLIGDVNQLPPVGHGAPLRDMIAAGVPYGELTEIHRNDGGIVQACADIRDGKQFKSVGNLQLIECKSANEQIKELLDLLDKQDDPVWSCQPMVAVNKKSELSREKLNKILQEKLNPNPAIPGQPFRLVDKVVCLKNGYYPPANDWAEENQEKLASEAEALEEISLNERGDIYAANGEIGRVVKVEQKYMVVVLQSPTRAVIVPRGQSNGGGTGCNWDLGYALSVHKMQGSEIKTAIVMIDDSASASRVCDKHWWYTAISRAKQCCYLIGKESVVIQHCKRETISKRKTFLKELLAP